MFDNLSERLQGILKDLRGEGRLTEAHVEKSMREIRIALLEADVHFKVVRSFVDQVKQRALGQEVLGSLTPGQQLVKVVRDELVELFGKTTEGLQFAKTPPTVILMVGLQGSGKTTSTGKLARRLAAKGQRPLLVSTDVSRPAAIEQLRVIGEAVEIPVFELPGAAGPLELAEKALSHSRSMGYSVLLVDTAGRLHVDEELMGELRQMQERLNPSEILLVADAMTGQDAVKSAGRFDKDLALTGVLLTKMDGDARGGAALSIRSITGKPIKFVGTGEKYDALEVFHPDRMAGRILGMGDVLSLIEKAEKVVDERKAEDMIRKMRRNEFTLEDFLDQLRQVRNLGPLDQILGMLPQLGPLKGLNQIQVDEKQLAHLEAIISSMTTRERLNHKILNGSRRRRIARGSGRPVSEVNRLLKQYLQTRKMMKRVSKGFLGKKLPKFDFPI